MANASFMAGFENSGRKATSASVLFSFRNRDAPVYFYAVYDIFRHILYMFRANATTSALYCKKVAKITSNHSASDHINWIYIIRY